MVLKKYLQMLNNSYLMLVIITIFQIKLVFILIINNKA